MESEQEITCVVADDHGMLRRGLASYLRAEPGMSLVGEAEDTATAWAIVERRRPTVLVLDLALGGPDPLEICRRIVAAELPTYVVIYTGRDDVEALEAALEAGARGYVVKSGPLADLTRCLRFVATGQVYVDGSLGHALVRRSAGPERSLLSAREREVLGLLADGMTTEEAAGTLFLSAATVRTYAESAMRKLQVRNRVHLVAEALRRGILV